MHIDLRGGGGVQFETQLTNNFDLYAQLSKPLPKSFHFSCPFIFLSFPFLSCLCR